MIADFGSLLELFAGFGLAVYFLVEKEMATKLFGQTFEDMAEDRIKKSLKEVDNNLSLRTSFDKKDQMTMAEIALNGTPVKQVFINDAIAAFRYDFFTISLFAITLIVVTGFCDHLTKQSLAAFLFNFSIFTGILCLDRLFNKEPNTSFLYRPMLRDMLRVFIIAVLSILLTINFQPQFPVVAVKLVMVVIVFFPVLLLIARLHQGPFRRYLQAYRDKNRKPSPPVSTLSAQSLRSD